MPNSVLLSSERHLQSYQMQPSMSADSAATSTLRPKSLNQLRDSLFLNPSTLHHLRTEAAERFLRWRDLNAALRQPDSPTVHPLDMSNSRELTSSGGARPQTRGRASSVGSTRSSGIIFSSSQTTPRPLPTRTSVSGAVRSPLAGVEEEHQHQPDWMWNWESRFSRDVHEQQQRQPPASTSASRPALSSIATARMPLAATTSGSTILELNNPSGTVRNRRALRSPPLLHDPSPPRPTDENRDEPVEGPEEPDDPLHLRSVARLAVSVVPALLRRYRIIGSRSVSGRSSRRRDRDGHQRDGDDHERRARRRGKEKLSWRMFGLGVSVGVVLSICIVGIGMELSQRVWVKA